MPINEPIGELTISELLDLLEGEEELAKVVKIEDLYIAVVKRYKVRDGSLDKSAKITLERENLQQRKQKADDESNRYVRLLAKLDAADLEALESK